MARKTNRTSDQLKRERAIREQFQKARPAPKELLASGEYTIPMKQGEYFDLMRAISALKQHRLASGISLSAVAESTGMDKAALSRLETGVHDNPTIATLSRYAAALGKKLVLGIVDD